MNREELIRRVAGVLRETGVRKPISTPKKVFHISDDDGNSKDFVLKKTEKDVLYTADDVRAIIDAFVQVVKEAIMRGDPVSLHGFGTLGVKLRKARSTRDFNTGERVDIAEHYVPTFKSGSDLRMCAKIYEQSLKDAELLRPLPLSEREDTGGDD